MDTAPSSRRAPDAAAAPAPAAATTTTNKETAAPHTTAAASDDSAAAVAAAVAEQNAEELVQRQAFAAHQARALDAALASASAAAAASVAAAAASSTAAQSDNGAWWTRSLSSSGAGRVRGDPSLRLACATGGSRDGGRSVRIGNGCPAGTELMAESAFVCALQPQEVERRCAHCWAMLVAQPAASSADEPSSSSTVLVAAKPQQAQPIQRCGGCGAARYCARACQAAHWRLHRLECECLRHYKSRPRERHPAYMPTANLVLRIVLWRLQRPLRALREEMIDPRVRAAPTYAVSAKKREADKLVARDAEAQEQFDDFHERFEHLLANLDEHTPERKQQYVDAAALVREVTLHACANDAERQLHTHLFPLEWFVATFARISCNSFSVSDDELRPVGSAVLPSLAMLNHSCAPNALASFSFAGAGGGGSGSGASVSVSGGMVVAKIRAMRSIQPGEEVCISYIGLAQPRSARQNALRTSYFFECSCVACTEAADDDDEVTLAGGDSSVVASTDAPKRRRAQQWLRNKSFDAFKCEHAWNYDPRNVAPAAAEAEVSSTAASSSSSSKSSSSTCSGILLPNPSAPSFPRCSQCGRLHNLALLQERMAAEVLPAMSVAQAASKKLEGMHGRVAQKDVPTLVQARSQLEAGLAALSRAHAPPAFPLLSCLDSLVLVCIDLEDWEAARGYVARSLPFYDAYYSSSAGLDNHPLLALQLLMHAKLSWLLHRPSEALASWKRALPILRISHGPNHALVQQVLEAIPPAEMEAQQERSTSRRIKA